MSLKIEIPEGKAHLEGIREELREMTIVEALTFLRHEEYMTPEEFLLLKDLEEHFGRDID